MYNTTNTKKPQTRPIDLQSSPNGNPHTAIVRSRSQQEQPSVNPMQIASVVTASVIACGVFGYAGVIGIQNATKSAETERVVAERLAKDGMAQMSDSEIASYLDRSQPVLDQFGELRNIPWEAIIKNSAFAPGIYLTSTTVIHKGTVGSGQALPGVEPLIGHKFGYVKPEDAASRVSTWKRSTEGLRR